MTLKINSVPLLIVVVVIIIIPTTTLLSSLVVDISWEDWGGDSFIFNIRWFLCINACCKKRNSVCVSVGSWGVHTQNDGTFTLFETYAQLNKFSYFITCVCMYKVRLLSLHLYANPFPLIAFQVEEDWGGRSVIKYSVLLIIKYIYRDIHEENPGPAQWSHSHTGLFSSSNYCDTKSW